MAQLPDVHCWIRVIDGSTGKSVANGKDLAVPGQAVVRYVVTNDSDRTVGPIWVAGTLRRDGVRIKPAGKSNVVPMQQITLLPNQVWKQEYAVSEGGATKGLVGYSAKLLADIGNAFDEADESNNKAQHAFGFLNIT